MFTFLSQRMLGDFLGTVMLVDWDGNIIERLSPRLRKKRKK